jgi:activator of HSP90 ATPase
MEPKIILVRRRTSSFRHILDHFSRDELREYARSIGVRTGRNKQDTITNLMVSDKLSISVSLGD